MGLVLGLKIGGVIATAAESARKAATRTASSDAIRVLSEVYREHLTFAEVEVAAEQIAELAAEAAADGIATSIMQIYPDLTTVYCPTGFKGLRVDFLNGYNEVQNLIKDFSEICSIFLNATDIPHCVEKLENTEKQMKSIKNGLDALFNDNIIIRIKEAVVPLAFVKGMLPLIAGMGTLKRLAEDVEEQTKTDNPITKVQIDSLKRGLDKIITPLMVLESHMGEIKFPTFISTVGTKMIKQK